MKITGIDPFSIREERPKLAAPKEKPQVAPTEGAQLDSVTREKAGENKIVDIIEEAQRRARKRQAQADRRRRKALITYTKVGIGARPLLERGKKLDTRG